MNETRTQELEILLNNAFSDEDSIRTLFAAETPEEAHKMLLAKGVQITLEEVKSLPDALRLPQYDGELSEDELEDVAGGIVRGGCVIIFPKHRVFPPILIPTW